MAKAQRVRRRWPWVVLALLLVAYLVPALFVLLYDPSRPRTPSSLEEVLVGERPMAFLLGDGYTKGWSSETSSGSEHAPSDVRRRTYSVVREPLHRAAGTFPLTVTCLLEPPEATAALELRVSTEEDWDTANPDHWTLIATGAPDGILLSTRLDASGDCPADATALEVTLRHADGKATSNALSMLTASTTLGRLYDGIACHPLFRWIPELERD